MKKNVVSILACLTVFMLGTWCFAAPAGAGGGAAKPITLKFNLVKTSSDPQFKWYGKFFSDVEKASNGLIKTEVYTSESLGTTADVLEQASQGEAVIADCDVAYLANYVPDFAMIMSPYLIQTPEEGLVVWNSDIFKNMCAKLEASGLHLLALNYEGTRNLITKSPVTSRKDVSRLKIRCAATPMWNAVVGVLNGNATNIPMSETYQALSQGVADGCEGVYSVIYSQKWFEKLKNITLTEHLIGFTAIAMSSKVYNALPEDARASLDKVAYNYMEEFLRLSGGVQEEYKQKLVAAGVTIKKIDKAEFIQAAQSIPSRFPNWSADTYKKLQQILESARKK